jgi:hypothetical protein
MIDEVITTLAALLRGETDEAALPPRSIIGSR